MTFGSTWDNPLENVEELLSGVTLVTQISPKEVPVTNVQVHRVLIQYRDDDETIPEIPSRISSAD